MEITDIISLVIVVIVVIVKALWAAKSKPADPDSGCSSCSAESQPRQDFTWEELFGSIRKSEEQRIPEEKTFSMEYVSNNSNVPEEQNAAGYTGSGNSCCACAEKSDTVQIDDPEEPEKIDWVNVIRNNRTEAVVLSEILAPPPSLR